MSAQLPDNWSREKGTRSFSWVICSSAKSFCGCLETHNNEVLKKTGLCGHVARKKKIWHTALRWGSKPSRLHWRGWNWTLRSHAKTVLWLTSQALCLVDVEHIYGPGPTRQNKAASIWSLFATGLHNASLNQCRARLMASHLCCSPVLCN